MILDDDRRIVITGMGVISSLGKTVEEHWNALIEGRSGIRRMTLMDPSHYPCQVAGEVPDFDPEHYMERREARRMARSSQMAVASARLALADSGLSLQGPGTVERDRIGVLLGTGNGSMPVTEEGARVMIERGGMRIDPLFFPRLLPNMAAGQVSLQLSLGGYNSTVVTACAASTQAIGEARDVLLLGRADAMIAGGAEAGISELGLAGFSVMRALSTGRNDEPERASRPFDKDRDGFVPAEGAAAFVLERLDRALARRAAIYAEVAGFASTADAYHIVAPDPDGGGASRAIQGALDDAGIRVEDVDYINAHGTSTPLNDVSETKAIKLVFGEQAYQTPISSTKSMIGHALGAAGALESIGCVQALRTGVIHPTINYETPDPECDLDHTPNVARRANVRYVLKNSFGFGGQNACLIFKRWEGA